MKENLVDSADDTSALQALRTPSSMDAVEFTLVLATIGSIFVTRGLVVTIDGPSVVDDPMLFTPPHIPIAMLLLIRVGMLLVSPEQRAAPRPTQWPLPIKLLALLGIWSMVSFSQHPSWRGLYVAFLAAGAWAFLSTVSRANRRQRECLLTFLVSILVVQAVFALAQTATGDLFGLKGIEFQVPMYNPGTSKFVAGRGSMYHSYHLGAILVVGLAAAAALRLEKPRLSGWSLVAGGVMGTAIALAFSRAVLLAVVPMVLSWAVKRHTRALAFAASFGILIGFFVGVQGWIGKVERMGRGSNITSSRNEIASEALELIRAHPFVGVGPGRYLEALPSASTSPLPSHNILLHVAAETGIVGGVLLLLTLLALIDWLRRRGLMVLATGAGLLILHLLDSYPHIHPIGIVVSSLWLSVVLMLNRIESDHQEKGKAAD